MKSNYEFDSLSDTVKFINPTKIVEIGSLLGGSLGKWMVMCNPGSIFVSIDKMVEPENPQYEKQRYCHNRLWYEWANEKNHILQIIEGDAQDPKVIETLYTKYKPVDFLYIIRDQTYNLIKEDFLNYYDLVRSGGIIAVGNIISEEINRFWNEIRDQYLVSEFVLPGSTNGIGVVYKGNYEDVLQSFSNTER